MSTEPATPSVAHRICTANPGVLWESIIADTSGRVFVFDDKGVVLYANAEAERKYREIRPDGLVGRTLIDMAGPRLGKEWAEAKDRVIASRCPLVFETVHRGVKIRAVLRPLVFDGAVYILVVSRDIADLMPRDWGLDLGLEVVAAKHRDLGILTNVTQRETEILGLIGEGLSSAQIADILGRSVKTVEWHRHQIGQKLGVKSRVELANIAMRAGLCRFERYPRADALSREATQPSNHSTDAAAGNTSNTSAKSAAGDPDDTPDPAQGVVKPRAVPAEPRSPVSI